MKRILLPLAALGTLAGGCTPFDAHVGEVQHWNIAQQVVDPDRHYPDSREGDSGQRGAAAVTRLENGAVKQPVPGTTTVRTSDDGGAGSSGRSPN